MQNRFIFFILFFFTLQSVEQGSLFLEVQRAIKDGALDEIEQELYIASPRGLEHQSKIEEYKKKLGNKQLNLNQFIPIIFQETGRTSYLYSEYSLKMSQTINDMLDSLGKDYKDPIVFPNIKKTAFEQALNPITTIASLQDFKPEEIQELIKTLDYLDFTGEEHKALWKRLVTHIVLNKSEKDDLFDRFFTVPIEDGKRIPNLNSILLNDDSKDAINGVRSELLPDRIKILNMAFPLSDFSLDNYKCVKGQSSQRTRYKERVQLLEKSVSRIFDHYKGSETSREKIVQKVLSYFERDLATCQYDCTDKQSVLISLALKAIEMDDAELLEELAKIDKEFAEELEEYLNDFNCYNYGNVILWDRYLVDSNGRNPRINSLRFFLNHDFKIIESYEKDSVGAPSHKESLSIKILSNDKINSESKKALIRVFLANRLDTLWDEDGMISGQGSSTTTKMFLSELLSKPEDFWKPILDSIKDHKDFNGNVIAVFAKKAYYNEETKNKFIQWILNTKGQDALDLIMPFLSESELYKWASYLEPETD